MKTIYLDNEIILLEGYKKEGTATPYQLRKLKEYLEIKQLIIANVVGQSEQLVCDCGDSNMTWYGNDDDKKWFCFSCKKEAN